MDSPDNYVVKIIAIGSALSEMTQQARNTFNYWNIKIKSPTLLQIIIAFIPYNKTTNFYLADCPQYFLCLKQKKNAPCNWVCLCKLSYDWLIFWLSSVQSTIFKILEDIKEICTLEWHRMCVNEGCGYNPHMSYKKKSCFISDLQFY